MKERVDSMERIALEEIENTKDAIPLVRMNSRLGWEPSMEYIGSEHYYLSVYLVSLLLVLVFIAFMIKRFMKEKRALAKREQ